MIPTLILFGLLIGRWRVASLAVGTAGWPALLWVGGIISSLQEVLGAAAFAFGNTLIGVVVHQTVLHLVRATRRQFKVSVQSGT